MSSKDDEIESVPYANSESNAEKAELGGSPNAPSQLLAVKKFSINSSAPLDQANGAAADDGAAVVTRDTKKEREFREDAKIWRYYLDEAERKAKEQAVLWNTGLDSLLIFAGLFAGIVSSFVIDARRDLQTNSEQRLLAEIREAVLQGSVSPPERISVASNWTSGLWVLSLYTTLFSAIMGVLAKAWLAKFIPSTSRREAKDAYHRYKLDRQAIRWRLKEVLILVPLLVQIATFLFLVGLILQSHADNPTMGRTLLAFCISGGLVYLSMTLVPVLQPSSPFNTPLYELCDGLFTRDPDDSAVPFKRDINEGLGDIFYSKLIKSPKPLHVDEAFAEVALQSFHEKWIEVLARKDTADVLLSRLRQCAATRTNNWDQRDETLCNHLLALLKFATLYEKKLTSGINNIRTLREFEPLDRVLRKALEPGYPLHRWNELPDDLRPLVFGLRAQVLMLLPPIVPKRGELPTPVDFQETELAERPWDMALLDFPSSHRLHFMLGACRGLAKGQQNLKTISAFALDVSLARAALTASETGRTSEWAASLTPSERSNVDALASQYLSALYDATVLGWQNMAANALTDVCAVQVTLEETLNDQPPPPHAMVMGSLILSLSQSDRMLRIHAIKMLKYVSLPDPKLFTGIIDPSISSIATMTVYDDQDVRDDGLDLLIDLAKSDEIMCSQIRNALVESITSGLSNYEIERRLYTIKFIEVLARMPENSLSSAIDRIIPDLVEVALDPATPEDLQTLALKLCEKLDQQIDRSRVKDAVIKYLSSGLDTSDYHLRHNFLEGLTVLVKENEFRKGPERPSHTFPWLLAEDYLRDVLSAMFEKIVNLAIHDTSGNVGDAQAFLTSLANEAGELDKYPLTIDALAWLEAATAQPSRWVIRLNGVQVLKILYKQLKCSDHPLLKKLIFLASKDEDDDVRSTSLDLLHTMLSELEPDENDFEAVKSAILSLDSPPATASASQVVDSSVNAGDTSSEITTSANVESASPDALEPPREPGSAILDDPYGSIRAKWVPLLGIVAKHASFPASISIILRIYTSSSGDQMGQDIATLFEAEEFAGPEYQSAFARALPKDLSLKLPKTDSWYETAKWMELLFALLPISFFRDVCENALVGVVGSMRDALNAGSNTPGANEDDDSTGNGSADYGYYSASTLSASLRSHLGKVSWDDRCHWVKALAHMASSYSTRFEDAPAIILQIAIHDPDNDVRRIALQSLCPLAKSTSVQEDVLSHWSENMSKLAHDGDWRVRFALLQVLEVLGKSSDVTLSDDIIAKIVQMALLDSDYDVRSEAVNTMAILADHGEHKYAEGVAQTIHDNFEKGMDDPNRLVRSAWVKFVVPHIKDANFFGLTKIFDAAIKDSTSVEDQVASLEALRRLLEDSTLRDSLSAAFGQSLASALKNPDLCGDAAATLRRLTSPKSRTGGNSDDNTDRGHETWVQIILLLARNTDFQEVPKLLEMVIKDVPESFMDLEPLFQRVRLADPIQNSLPKCLEASLKLDSNADTRSSAVTLLHRLIGRADGAHFNWQNHKVLSKTYDAQLISRLSDVAVKDADADVRKNALELLKIAFESHRYQDSIKTTLSKTLEGTLRDPEWHKFRAYAVSSIHNLAESKSGGSECGPDDLMELVSPSIPQLLKITFVVSDKEHESLRKEAEEILLKSLTASTTETKLNRDVLRSIPNMIPTITIEGKAMALQLADSLPISDETATSVAHALAPMLRNASSFARATAIELLSTIYARHRQSKPSLIESTIPEIIALALDDQDDVGGIRVTAIQLLIALSAVPGSNDGEHVSASSFVSSSPVLKQITPLAMRFLSLLHNENLRASVVELLSLMATDAQVRRIISIQIIRLAFGPESESLVGHAELLVRLISDGRFTNEPTDYVMLLLASPMVTRPKLYAQRFQILTALWCRYRKNPFESSEFSLLNVKNKELVDWFTFALFGRHATVHEVPTWLERCATWMLSHNEAKQ